MAHPNVHRVIRLSPMILVNDVEFPDSGIRVSLQLKSRSTPTATRSAPIATYYSDTDKSDRNEKVSSPTSLKRKRPQEHPRVFETNHIRLCIKRGVEMAGLQPSKRLKIRIPAQNAAEKDGNPLGASSRANVNALPPTAPSSSAAPQELKEGGPQSLKVDLAHSTKPQESKRSIPLGDDGTTVSSTSQDLNVNSHFKIKIPPLSRPGQSDQNDHPVATTTSNAMEPPYRVVFTYPRRISPLPKRYRQ
jgi:hypothetical protein